MKKIARFEKVSLAQFVQDMRQAFPTYPEEALRRAWEQLELPKRATSGSAGHDFRLPVSVQVNGNEHVVVPTGIRCAMQPGWVLMLFPRSSLGFRYQMRLDNTAGIIDEDYHGAENEGHIIICFTAEKTLQLPAGSAFVQGVFLPYGICEDDEADLVRQGGFGSTGN